MTQLKTTLLQKTEGIKHALEEMRENTNRIIDDLNRELQELPNPFEPENQPLSLQPEIEQLKTMIRNRIEQEFIDSWKPIFDQEPELIALPVYAWGRYRKYELAGQTFERIIERGKDLTNLKELITDKNWTETYLHDLEEISEKYDDRISECEIGNYYPGQRNLTYVFNYDGDEPGGLCLVLYKNRFGDLKMTTIRCYSPE